MERWNNEVPALLDSTMKSPLQQFEQARPEGRKLDHAEGGDEFAGLFQVSVQHRVSHMGRRSSVRM
jgi:hypothetical protein